MPITKHNPPMFKLNKNETKINECNHPTKTKAKTKGPGTWNAITKKSSSNTMLNHQTQKLKLVCEEA